MLQKILYIGFFFATLIGRGQIYSEKISGGLGVFPEETTEIMVNSNLLLAGELLQYSTFSLTQDRSIPLSKMIYVSMRSETDSVVFSHKLPLVLGKANGDFFIPATLKTGIYQLISYTNFSRNNVENPVGQKSIYIINPFIVSTRISEKDLDSTKAVKIHYNDVGKFRDTEENQSSRALVINKNFYKPRENVSLEIKNPLPEWVGGSYVISVRKVEPVRITNAQNVNFRISSEVGKYFLPEVRGEIISGKIAAVEGNHSTAGKLVTLTIPEKDYIFDLVKTDSNGRFIFSLDGIYQTANAVVQLDETIREKYKIELDSKDLKHAETAQEPLLLSPDLKGWLEQRSVQLQVENAYYNIKKDSISPKPLNPSFFGGKGVFYLLDDYSRFPTVRETFIEVVTEAAVRNDGGSPRFLVYNKYDPNGTAKFNAIDPLVLVDGFLILDNNELLNYPSKDIESIRVITEPYRYGAQIYSGIIAVTTKKGDFRPAIRGDFMKEMEIQGQQRHKIYYSPDYSNPSGMERIPDYRVQLLWQPNFEIGNSDYGTSFYTSDVSGVFEVSLEGYTKEGNFVSVRDYFTVTDN